MILIICGIFIVENAKLFSKVSGARVFKTRYGWFDFFHCCWLLENSRYSFAGNVILFQTSIYPLHVFDRGSKFILLMEPFCVKIKRSFELHIQSQFVNRVLFVNEI